MKHRAPEPEPEPQPASVGKVERVHLGGHRRSTYRFPSAVSGTLKILGVQGAMLAVGVIVWVSPDRAATSTVTQAAPVAPHIEAAPPAPPTVGEVTWRPALPRLLQVAEVRPITTWDDDERDRPRVEHHRDTAKPHATGRHHRDPDDRDRRKTTRRDRADRDHDRDHADRGPGRHHAKPGKHRAKGEHRGGRHRAHQHGGRDRHDGGRGHHRGGGRGGHSGGHGHNGGHGGGHGGGGHGHSGGGHGGGGHGGHGH